MYKRPQPTLQGHITKPDLFTAAMYELLEISMNKKNLWVHITQNKNVEHLKYTMLHRNAMFRLAHQLQLTPSNYRLHDADKLVMYLVYDEETVNKWHRAHAEHHNRNTTDRIALLETILDWESAPYTKPDKPLNALNTLRTYYPDMKDRIMPLLKELGLDVADPPPCITQKQYERELRKIRASDLATHVKNAITDIINETRYSL